MRDLNKYYEFHTEGVSDDAEVVVIVPGVSGGIYMFEAALKFFLPNYKVLLLNNPGIGGAPMHWMMTVEKLADLFADILTHLGIHKCHIVGHSMGGFTAQKLLLQDPTRFDKAVFVSTSYGGPFSQKDATRMSSHVSEKVKGIDVRDKEMLRNEALKMVFSQQYVENHPNKFEAYAKYYNQNTPQEAVRVRHFWCGAHYNGFGQVHKIAHESLVIHGNEDHLVSFDGGRLLARQLQNARLWEIDACGHMPFVEKDNFYQRIIDFLNGERVGVEVEKDEPPHETELTPHGTWNMMSSLLKGWKK